METKIKQALKTGPKGNKELQTLLGAKPGKNGYDSKLDRKLQKLKKAGDVKLHDGRWALSHVHACPTCEGRGWVSERSERSTD